jgi:DNA-binding transcriptional regulator YiaG
MGKVEDALRDLIQYHSKHAAVAVVGDMPSQVRSVRKGLRALQRAVEKMSSDVRLLLDVRQREMAVPPAAEAQVEKVRFTKRTLKALRQRFDLTQEELAKLLEVSPVTVTAWETAKSKPRASNLAQIVTLRGMDQAVVDKALGRQPAPGPMKPAQIKRLRRKLGLTQADFARLLDVSGAAVTAWETGKTSPSRENRIALAALRGQSREADRKLGRHAAAGRLGGESGADVSPADVKAIRAALGLSQKELAAKLGVSTNSVSNWETGRSRPRRSTVRKLLDLR